MTALRKTLLACAAVMSVAAGQAGPPPEQPAGANDVADVVVTAPRVEAVRSFVQNVTVDTSNHRFARWNRTICPGVMGLKGAYAQHVNDQIAAVAMHVGLQVGEPGCKANILVVVAKDAQAYTAALVKSDPKIFNVSGFDGPVTRGRSALKDFIETPRPVRWWHISQTVGEDGKAVGSEAAGASPEGGAAKMRVRNVSRIKAQVRDDFSAVLIVVDSKMAGGVSLQALASYISMVALAQIDPDANLVGLPTILNLFADRDAKRPLPIGLTEWDTAYLEGAYLARQDRKAQLAAKRDIEKRMRDALKPTK